MKVNEYFGDLQIQAVTDKHFDSGQIHLPLKVIPGYYSLEMIAEGETDLICDGKRRHLNSPVVFWIRDTCSTFQFCGKNKPYHHIWIDFTGERGKRIYDFLGRNYPDDCIPIPPRKARTVLSLFQEIKEQFLSGEGYDPNEMTVKFELLICRITTANGVESHTGDPYRIYQVREMIRHDPFFPYDPAELAAERGISEVYFRLLFRRRFKIPFQRFLQQTRLDFAAMLLQEGGEYRIKELSDRCGFANISGFSNAFFRRFGVYPRTCQQEKKRLEDRR